MGKALIIAVGFALIYIIAFTILLRLFVIHKRAKAMSLLFLASVPAFTAVFFMTPPDLGFLPDWLVEPVFPVDYCFALFVYAAGYAGGILQLYNLADRGFSLRIVIDIARSPQGLTLDEVALAYSEGKGIQWMYDKRVQDLLASGLCMQDHDHLKNQPRGTRLAKVFGALRRFFHHPSSQAMPSPRDELFVIHGERNGSCCSESWQA